MTHVNDTLSTQLLQTAQSFKTLFESEPFMLELKILPLKERLRTRAIFGFTAIDALVSLMWKLEIVPEWENISTLIEAALHQKTNLDSFFEHLDVKHNKAQTIASLRFIQNTYDIESFAPTFVDLGLLFALNANQKSLRTEVASSLFELQKLRNASLHTAKTLEIEDLQRAQDLIQDFFEKTKSLHPFFKDVGFSTNVFIKKAA